MQPTKEGKISVSVMCSDLMNLERDIKQLERNGVDYLHVDVMDAHFVPNLTFGVDFTHSIRFSFPRIIVCQFLIFVFKI